MRQLSIERQNRTGLRQKAKWALHEEKRFRRLIEVIELVQRPRRALSSQSSTPATTLQDRGVRDRHERRYIGATRDRC
ncbi:hypothetical protein K469DRAFT_27243 [Zopfia rhizophila CBS 207.26]|uniref:Prion-inhibition and propagation HeLo domain-containing protein n=1 Tax=Zopfia rhizophila CBS 207.26 TaxID=1314779 RepID=A0A6A6EK57_9PEZI|nr:hypothetical protein K469DRAFT_27243 [Zopfia rhizophila CBS 207.26]